MRESQMAALRYTLFGIGVAATATGFVDEMVWDQITTGVLSLVVMLWGVEKTSGLEDDKAMAIAIARRTGVARAADKIALDKMQAR